MKKLFSILFLAITPSLLTAQVSKTVNVSAGNLYTVLTVTERNTTTNLTVTGTINASDFVTMRDNMPLLSVLDLSDVTVIDNSIPDHAFMETYKDLNRTQVRAKTSLTSIILPKLITTIGSYAFSNCSSLVGSLIIPSSVTDIGEYAFSFCPKLTSLILPNSLTKIGSGAFRDCWGFTGSLIIPSSVISIGWSAFNGCRGFTGSLIIPSSVTNIENYAFDRCSGFTGSLIIPSSITNIPNGVFESCSGFTGSLIIPSSVTNIEGYAFYGCSGFTGSLTIPSAVILIEGNAFTGCSGITGSLIIPSSVTNIGDYAFSGCSNLSSLYINNKKETVTINKYAFSECSNLNKISVSSSIPPTISTNTFDGVNTGLCKLYIPIGSNLKYQLAYGWRDLYLVNEVDDDKSIVCGESVQINGITPKYDIGDNLNYSWTPTIGLDNPNTKSPIATPNISTNYEVTAKTSTGDIYDIDSIKVTVNPLYVDAGADKTIICGGSTKLDSVHTNYTGSGTLKYKWMPSIGLSNDTIPNPVVYCTENTTYIVNVTTPKGSCSAVDTVKVIVNPLTANAGLDKTIICGISVQLDKVITNYTGTGILKYKWTPSTGLNNDTIANPLATVTSNSTYTVTVTTPNGCSASDNVLVTVAPLTANAGVDKTIICGGKAQLDNVTTNYTGSGVLKYKWTPATGLNNDTITNPIATVTSNTTYTVTITTPNGCSASDNVLVTVTPLSVNAGLDKTIVCGGTAQFNSVTTNYSGNGILKYKWTPATGLNNDSIANPIATVTSNTTYTVKVTTPNDCFAVDSVKVIVNPLTANAGVDKSIICGGKAQLDNITTNYSGNGVLKYKWSPSTGLNNDTIANPITTVTSNSTYTVTVTTPNGCSAVDNVLVTVTPLSVNAGLDKTIVCGGTAQFNSVTTNYTGNGILKYKWTPSTGLNNDTITNPIATVTSNSTYTVTVTTPNGCSASDQIVINVESLQTYNLKTTVFFDESFTDKTGWSSGWSGTSGLYGGTATISWTTPGPNQINLSTVNKTTSMGYTFTFPPSDNTNLVDVAFDWQLDNATITANNAFGLMLNGQSSTIVNPQTIMGLYLCGNDGKFHIWNLDSLEVFKYNGVFNQVGVDLAATNALNSKTQINFPFEFGISYNIKAKMDFTTHLIKELRIKKVKDNSEIVLTNIPFVNKTVTNISKITILNSRSTNIGNGDNVSFTTSFDNIRLSKSEITTDIPVKTINCGSTTQLDNITTNYSGNGILKYKWTPATGLNNDSIASPIASVTSNTTYTVTVTTPNGCSVTSSVQVVVNPLTVNAGVDQTFVCGTTVQLGTTTNYSGSGSLRYKWTPSEGLNNDTISNPIVNQFKTMNYTITVTTPNGCTASDYVKVEPTISSSQKIALVSVDNNNKNMVLWSNLRSNYVDSVYIYKESSITDVYDKIGAALYVNQLFIDTLSKPKENANRYKITLKDKCGFETPASEPHKTMHLSINQGQGNSWNLIWEPYSGFVVSTYNVYRGTTPDNLTLLSSIAGVSYQYSDYNPPLGSVYYQVEVVAPSTQFNAPPQGAMNKVKSVSYTTSRSNIATNIISGINEFEGNNKINIYPNPVKNELMIEFEGGSTFEILNLMGQSVYTGNLIKSTIVQTANLSSGVYLIKFKTGNSFEYKKIIKE